MEVSQTSGTSEGLHSTRDIIYGQSLSTPIFPPDGKKERVHRQLYLSVLLRALLLKWIFETQMGTHMNFHPLLWPNMEI